MTPRRSHRPIFFLAVSSLGVLLWPDVQAGGQDQPKTETTSGWLKSPKSPVLGGDLGTCIDITVLKQGDTYQRWFSWRPKKSIALVESNATVTDYATR